MSTASQPRLGQDLPPEGEPWPEFGSQGYDAVHLRRLVDSCRARLDRADHRMLLLLRTLFLAGDELDEPTRALLEDTVLGFRYSLMEPGTDDLVTWTESHQLVFSTCELLAGQLLPDEVFRNDQRKGIRHQRSAEQKLITWLSDRFRFGFSEWLSGGQLLINAAALTMIIDHSENRALVCRAEMVLDLVMLDLALHRFQGTFAASQGRATAEDKQHPERAGVQCLCDAAFGQPGSHTPAQSLDAEQLCVVFRTRQRYRVPPMIIEIARDESVRRVFTSQGLDVGQVAAELAVHPLAPRGGDMDLLRFWWGMGALATPETIRTTLGAIHLPNLRENRRLEPLRAYTHVPAAGRSALFRALDPIVSGVALQRADVQTFRTRSYLLSSAQHYQPGGWGDQQSIWQALLPGGVSVFATHPGGTTISSAIRDSTPWHWVGNGINPHVAQHDNVLLAMVDLTRRRGFLEAPRQELVHFWFPAVDFDETRLGASWVAGRRDQTYIGIVMTGKAEMISETEVVQRGVMSGYAVLLSDDEEFTSMSDFVRHLKLMGLALRRDVLSLHSPYARYELTWRKGLSIGGRPIPADYPRYDTQWGTVPRNPVTVDLRTPEHSLRLDWEALTREVD